MFLKTCSRGILLKLFSSQLTAAGAAATGMGRSFSSASSCAARVVDLRTDTAAKPGPAMRKAMAEAEVEYNMMGEDPTVRELEEIAAEMFQMEAALFVPSGTMSNLIAVMVHCRERDNEMIVGDLSHLQVFAQGGSAQIGSGKRAESRCRHAAEKFCGTTGADLSIVYDGSTSLTLLAAVHAVTATTLPDGTFDLEEVESKISHKYPDPHFLRSRLICLENTHNIRGGRVLPLTFLDEVRALADKHGLSVHMDGARVMNAAVAQGVPPSTIVQHAHTVSLCLCKGLGAPVGSILAGPQNFISQAVRCRQALGGWIPKAGMLAAAGKVSLLEMVGRLEEDHRNAKIFAQALHDCNPPLFAVDVDSVETNIVCFNLRDSSLSPSEFCARMGQVNEGEEATLGQGVQVHMHPYFRNVIRAVWHLGISREDTQLAIQKMQFVASQYLREKLSAKI